jgi:hypothetical protein
MHKDHQVISHIIKRVSWCDEQPGSEFGKDGMIRAVQDKAKMGKDFAE